MNLMITNFVLGFTCNYVRWKKIGWMWITPARVHRVSLARQLNAKSRFYSTFTNVFWTMFSVKTRCWCFSFVRLLAVITSMSSSHVGQEYVVLLWSGFLQVRENSGNLSGQEKGLGNHQGKWKIGATRCQIFRLKCIKFDFRWSSAPDPAGGAYSAPPDLLAVFNIALLMTCFIVIIKLF